jgi:hypothetical protein
MSPHKIDAVVMSVDVVADHRSQVMHQLTSTSDFAANSSPRVRRDGTPTSHAAKQVSLGRSRRTENLLPRRWPGIEGAAG